MKKQLILSLSLFSLLTIILVNCKKKEDPTPTTPITATAPTIDNSANATGSSDITATSAKVSSTLSANGGAAISQHGHVWSETNATPTTADTKTELGKTDGPFPLKFTSELKSLKANTTYNVRPYAINGKGTTYGNTAQVKTGAEPVTSSGNFLYYGTEKGLVAIDASNSMVVWQNLTIGYVNYAPFVHTDKVIVGANNNIFALDTKSGTIKWEFKSGASGGVNITVDKGIVYATTDGNKMVYAVDANTGVQKWAYQAEGSIQQQPSIDNNLVFASSYGDGMLFALDKNTGLLKWKKKGGGGIAKRETGALDGNLIGSASTLDSSLVCFDALTGKSKWNGGKIGYYDKPTIVEKTVYLAQVFDLKAIDINTGKQLWVTPISSGLFYPSASFTVGNGFVYATGGDGILYGLDLINGSKKWTYSKVDKDSSPTLASDLLYVIGEKTGTSTPKTTKELFVLDAKTGAVKSTISTVNYPPTTRITVLINGKTYYAGALSIYQ